jgi:signal transduction histidine kinase
VDPEPSIERSRFERQLREWQQEWLQKLLRVVAVLALVGSIVCVWQIRLGRLHWSNLVFAGVLFVLTVIAIRAPQSWHRFRVCTLALGFYMTGAIGSLGGIVSLFGAGFVGFVAVATLFAGRRGALIALLVTSAHTLAIAIAFQFGALGSIITSAGLDPRLPTNWVRATIFILIVSAVLAACITSLLARLQQSLQASLDLVDKLQGEKDQRMGMQEQIVQAQRMEALGRLAGGIAHDFNNALTVMGGEADYIVSEIGEDHPIGESAEIIRQATERAAALTRRLLLFGRHKEFLQPKPVDLFTLLNEFLRISRRVLPESVELAFDKCEPAVVDIDSAALHQALLNLAINAGDAMNQEGRITLSCGVSELEAGDTPLDAGRYGFIAVSDTGIGIGAEYIEQIFDPFFSTERDSKVGSSGMGLASSFGFATASGGTIEVQSEPGVGSTFTLYFPVTDKPVQSAEAYLGSIEGLGKGQLALIAEDNLRVRAFMWSALIDAGYEVLEASDGAAAHALAMKCERPISVLVTDYMMPKMDGVTLAERCHAANPNIKIVLVTGYATSGASKKLGEIPNTILLPKPFGRRALFHALQTMP